jgi:hypothetical protein
MLAMGPVRGGPWRWVGGPQTQPLAEAEYPSEHFVEISTYIPLVFGPPLAQHHSPMLSGTGAKMDQAQRRAQMVKRKSKKSVARKVKRRTSARPRKAKRRPIDFVGPKDSKDRNEPL